MLTVRDIKDLELIVDFYKDRTVLDYKSFFTTDSMKAILDEQVVRAEELLEILKVERECLVILKNGV